LAYDTAEEALDFAEDVVDELVEVIEETAAFDGFDDVSDKYEKDWGGDKYEKDEDWYEDDESHEDDFGTEEKLEMVAQIFGEESDMYQLVMLLIILEII
jgi:hypothetical protein